MMAWRLRHAARAVRHGGVIAYPTEAVYGLGCDPRDLIAADFDQLRPYVAEVAPGRMTEVLARWPGPHTWLLPARAQTPEWLTGAHTTLAVRVTAHPVARALCRLTGPLVSTSANPAGRRPARDPLTVRRYFDDALELILCGPVDRRRGPSAIRDAATGRLLRAS